MKINNILKQDFEYILNDKNVDWSKFAGKTILISGASGFLPAYMLQTLLYLNEKKTQTPAKVIGLVRNLEKAKLKLGQFLDDKNLVLIKQDISKPFTIDENIDYIIHAASQASPKYFLSDPVGTIKANTLGTNYLLEIAKEKEVKGFLYFSSGEVNGDAFEFKDSVSENDYGVINPLDVRSCYSESKKMGENMCACWHSQYKVPAKIVRPSHTYGPGFDIDDGRAFTSFIASAVQNKDIILKSDGSAKRSFCYLADATRAYFTVLLNGESGEAYNVGNKTEISILELAQLIIKISNNKNIKVKFEKNCTCNPSSKISNGLLDIKKIKELGWEPKISEEEGFLRTLNNFKNMLYN